MYIYIQSESELWTAGFYDPMGVWQPESDHSSKEEAAARVHWLNGGNAPSKPATAQPMDFWIAAIISEDDVEIHTTLFTTADAAKDCSNTHVEQLTGIADPMDWVFDPGVEEWSARLGDAIFIAKAVHYRPSVQFLGTDEEESE